MVTLKAYLEKRKRSKSVAADEDAIRSDIRKALAASRSFEEPSAQPASGASHGREEDCRESVQDCPGVQKDTSAAHASRGHAAGCAIQERGMKQDRPSAGVVADTVAERVIRCRGDVLVSEVLGDKDKPPDGVPCLGQHGAAESTRLQADENGTARRIAGDDAECGEEKEAIRREECFSGDERKRRLRSFAETPFVQILAHRYGEMPLLSPQLQKLSRLFTVVLSICKFNGAKDMMTIYHKSKKCIENLLNRRVSIADFEQINWLAPEALSFRQVEIMHFGEEVTSFTIEVTASSPRLVDERIMQFAKSMYAKGRRGGDISVPQKALFREAFSERYGFSEDAESAPKDCAENSKVHDRHGEAVERGRSKALTVLERIREKERVRRESFVARSREQEEIDILRRRVESYFAAENKTSEEVGKLVRILGVHGGRECMKRLCECHSCFALKEYEGKTFLVLTRPRT